MDGLRVLGTVATAAQRVLKRTQNVAKTGRVSSAAVSHRTALLSP